MKIKNLLLLGFLFVCLSNTKAETLRVPQEYASIQVALDAAVSGDIVLVAPGTYFENITIKATNNEVTLRGAGSEFSILDAQQLGRAIDTEEFNLGKITIEGFTIRNGFLEQEFVDLDSAEELNGCGVRILFGEAIIRDVIFEDNTVHGYHIVGVGLYMQDGEVVDCTFKNNHGTSDINNLNVTYVRGIGMAAAVDKELSIDNCVFEGHRFGIGAATNGGGLYVSTKAFSNVFLKNSIFRNNDIRYASAALIVGRHNESPKAFVENCLFEDNGSNVDDNYGSHAIFGSTVAVHMTGCEFYRNKGRRLIEFYDGPSKMEKCIFKDNIGQTFNTGWYTRVLLFWGRIVDSGWQGFDYELSNNEFSNNENCIAFTQQNFQANFEGNIYHNTIVGNAGGLYLENASYNINNNIIWDNNEFEISTDGVDISLGQSNFDNNLVKGGFAPGGQSIIDADPLFLDGGYYLSPDSPCVEAGKSGIAVLEDINSLQRPWPPNTLPDLGAYEQGHVIPSSVFNNIPESPKVIPNPTDGVILFDQTYDKLNVLTSDGKVIYSKQNVSDANFSNLASGIYWLVLTNGVEVWREKIVVF